MGIAPSIHAVARKVFDAGLSKNGGWPVSYSIKIGKHSIELAGYAGKVVAPNSQMEASFRGMR
ncbi:hypothetical protein ACLB1O_17780 [Escherichia coli]